MHGAELCRMEAKQALRHPRISAHMALLDAKRASVAAHMKLEIEKSTRVPPPPGWTLRTEVGSGSFIWVNPTSKQKSYTHPGLAPMAKVIISARSLGPYRCLDYVFLFRVSGFGFRISVLRVRGVGCRGQDVGCRVYGVRCRV
jgi:hypothetical protein